jgi:hypothetical protein
MDLAIRFINEPANKKSVIDIHFSDLPDKCIFNSSDSVIKV